MRILAIMLGPTSDAMATRAGLKRSLGAAGQSVVDGRIERHAVQGGERLILDPDTGTCGGC